MTRTFVGWILIGIWIVVPSTIAFATNPYRDPRVDCCSDVGIVVGITTFVIALFTLPIAIIGIWFINQATDPQQLPKVPITVVVAALVLLPIAAGLAIS